MYHLHLKVEIFVRCLRRVYGLSSFKKIYSNPKIRNVDRQRDIFRVVDREPAMNLA